MKFDLEADLYTTIEECVDHKFEKPLKLTSRDAVCADKAHHFPLLHLLNTKVPWNELDGRHAAVRNPRQEWAGGGYAPPPECLVIPRGDYASMSVTDQTAVRRHLGTGRLRRSEVESSCPPRSNREMDFEMMKAMMEENPNKGAGKNTSGAVRADDGLGYSGDVDAGPDGSDGGGEHKADREAQANGFHRLGDVEMGPIRSLLNEIAKRYLGGKSSDAFKLYKVARYRVAARELNYGAVDDAMNDALIDVLRGAPEWHDGLNEVNPPELNYYRLSKYVVDRANQDLKRQREKRQSNRQRGYDEAAKQSRDKRPWWERQPCARPGPEQKPIEQLSERRAHQRRSDETTKSLVQLVGFLYWQKHYAEGEAYVGGEEVESLGKLLTMFAERCRQAEHRSLADALDGATEKLIKGPVGPSVSEIS